MPELARLLPELALHDFDEVGVPPGVDKRWRQETTERWLRRGIEYRDAHSDLVVCGGALPGEIFACPSALLASPIEVCLLDCGDVVRLDRLRARGAHGVTQDMLNWAAWQRVHAVDPQWRPDVIRDGGSPAMRWERWETWVRGDPRWQVAVIDTTRLSVPEVAARLADWVWARTSKAAAGRSGALSSPSRRARRRGC